MSTPEGAYRCAECGHGKNLWAWEGCNAYGPLAADGSHLDEHEDVIEWGVHEDSIDCREHPGAVIEKFTKGRWCRWWSCPKCRGYGLTRDGQPVRERGYRCSEGIKRAEGRWDWDGKMHEGWIPASEHEALIAAEAKAS